MMLKLVNHSPRLNARLEKAKALLPESNLNALVIFKPVNLNYLTGFRGSSGALAVFPDKACLVIDARYEERAEREAANVEIWGGKNVRSALKDLLIDAGSARIGFEANGLTFAEYERYVAALTGGNARAELVPVDYAIERLRMIKDSGEVDDIKHAALLADACLSYLAGYIKPGLTEKQIADAAEFKMRADGAEAASFDIIVASGANSAIPHAGSTEKTIERGDLVLIDLGAVVNGYCSDITRSFVLGKPTPAQTAMHAVVLEALSQTKEAVRRGGGAAELDDLCRGLLERSEAPGKFLHSLGHGVGLEIHERPALGTGSVDTLDRGMVFTLEPGLYERGFGGVRLEDMILLEDEPAILTQFPRDLLEL
jgi:Xaa-Pro aminopeptidase